MKTQFHNLTPVKCMRDVLGYEWNKTPNFMHGFKHKTVDGICLLDVQKFSNNSKWDGLVEQTIADDGTVTMRTKEMAGEDYINNYLMDNVFHGFIKSDIEVDRVRMTRVYLPGPGKHVQKPLTRIVREAGYLYGLYKIVNCEQDTATGDYIFTMKPQKAS